MKATTELISKMRLIDNEILSDPFMVLAFEVHRCFWDGDYAGFFNILKHRVNDLLQRPNVGHPSNAYLFGCWMHHYFMEPDQSMRFHALCRMIKAYGTPRASFPLAELTNILCFNDEHHASSICQFFEIEVIGEPNEPDAKVVFDRKKMPVRPEVYLSKMEPGEWRQVSVLVNKLRGSMTRKMIVEAGDEGVTPEEAAAAVIAAREEEEERIKEEEERTLKKKQRLETLKAKMLLLEKENKEKTERMKSVTAAEDQKKQKLELIKAKMLQLEKEKKEREKEREKKEKKK